MIFPVTESQSNGIEDARFVEFSDGGRKTYYATYTAYSGKAIRSELIETRDFLSFRMSPLRGTAARNKGMALFPRRIDGKYAMIARQDNENLYLIYSDDLYIWDGGQAILKPEFPWEFVQIGNCGSPIELDEGWLLLTHGVGPVRKYSIGAALLDKDDPSKVLARSLEPLLQPEPPSAKATFPTWSTPAGRCAIAIRSFCLTPFRHLLQLCDHQDCSPAAGDVLNSEIARYGLVHSKEGPMARETSYFVQTFNAGRGGNLKADAPIACKTENGALRTAERLALSKLGVVAFYAGDPEMGDYDDEPTVFFRQGSLPSSFDSRLWYS